MKQSKSAREKAIAKSLTAAKTVRAKRIKILSGLNSKNLLEHEISTLKTQISNVENDLKNPTLSKNDAIKQKLSLLQETLKTKELEFLEIEKTEQAEKERLEVLNPKPVKEKVMRGKREGKTRISRVEELNNEEKSPSEISKIIELEFSCKYSEGTVRASIKYLENRKSQANSQETKLSKLTPDEPSPRDGESKTLESGSNLPIQDKTPDAL